MLASPHDAQVHALLGIVLSESNDLSSGEWHFRRALELEPAHAECLANLAINLTRQGRADEAEPHFARADEIMPGKLQVLAQWSRLHELQGNLQRADELLDRAAAASSAQHVELLRVTYLVRKGQHQEALAILEAAPELSGDAQLERGRLYDRLGRHAEAWRDWEEGKAKLAAQTSAAEYQPAAVEASFTRLKRYFVRQNIELLPRASVRRDVAQPIFILGFPRSGTTLIERVLASHSAIRAAGELTFVGEWPQLIDRLLARPAFPENLAQACTADWHHLAYLLRDYYYARAEARGLLEHGKRFFVDKMPFNEMWLPLIRMAFPHARIVRVLRHPADTCVSMLSHQLTHGFNCGYRIETIVHQLCAMSDLTQHYRREFDPVDCTLRYEDFVRRPEQEVRRLLDYLELPFESACLDFHDNRRYAATPSYAQVTQALSERAIDRHAPYRTHLQSFVPQLEPWAASWNYDL